MAFLEFLKCKRKFSVWLTWYRIWIDDHQQETWVQGGLHDVWHSQREQPCEEDTRQVQKDHLNSRSSSACLSRLPKLYNRQSVLTWQRAGTRELCLSQERCAQRNRHARSHQDLRQNEVGSECASEEERGQGGKTAEPTHTHREGGQPHSVWIWPRQHHAALRHYRHLEVTLLDHGTCQWHNAQVGARCSASEAIKRTNLCKGV